MRTLIVTLPPPGESTSPSVEYDYVLSHDGLQVGSAAITAAALLPQPTGPGAEVVAVVPARALSCLQVDLPSGTCAASPRLRAVLECLPRSPSLACEVPLLAGGPDDVVFTVGYAVG